MANQHNRQTGRRRAVVATVVFVTLLTMCAPVAQGLPSAGPQSTAGPAVAESIRTTTTIGPVQQVASPEGTISLNESSQTVSPGETFWVAVQYNASTGASDTEVAGAQFTLNYNTSVLNATGSQIGPYIQGQTIVDTIDDDAGTYGFGVASTGTAATGSGDLAYVRFTVTTETDAPVGALTSLNFTGVQVSDPAVQPIPTAIENGTVDTTDPYAPSASFTATPSTANVSEAVTFGGGNSSDNFRIGAYEWEFGDGTNTTSSAATTTHAYSDLGEYQATLTVVDEDGNTNTTTRTVTVVDQVSPGANVTAQPTTAELNVTTVTLDASNSTDNDEIAYYEWDVDNDGETDENTTSPSITNTFTELGDAVVSVTAVDRSGNNDTAETTVTVQDTTPPTAAVSPNESTTVRSSPVVFDAGGSTDNGQIAYYEWDFDDDGETDENTTSPSVANRFTELGDAVVSVTVVDESGNRAVAETTVTVENQGPTADAGADLTVDEETTVELDATNSSDPDDADTITYEWEQTTGETVTLADDRTATPTFTAPDVAAETTLEFQVTVIDGNGGSDTDTVNVIVQPTNDPPVADAGADQLINGTETVQLDGTASTDPNDDDLNYTWSQVAGPAVTLNDAESATPTFTAPDTETTIEVVFDLEVSDGNLTDTDMVNVTIEPLPPEPANFTVSDLDAPSAVTQGDAVTVTANVTNTGELDGTQDVDFRLDIDRDGVLDADETLANETLTLAGGENQTVEFTVLTGELSVGTYLHGVVTQNDSQTAELIVSERPEPANFSVSDLDAPATVTQGDIVTVTVNVTNTGELDGTQDVDFRLDTDGDGTLDADETVANETLTLAGDESQPVEFTVSTADVPVGTYLHGVVTRNDSQTAEITIEEPEPANFSVGDLDAPSTVTQGDTVTITANVTNTGEVEGTQDVDFRLDTDESGTLDTAETLANETLTLAGGENRTVEFEVSTAEVPVGTYLHGIVTRNDSQTAELAVEEPPEPANFSVSDLDAPATVTQGDTVTVTANVTNVGELEGTQDVDFRLDTDGDGTLDADETVANETLTLAGDESQPVEFTVSTADVPVGTYLHGVVTRNDSQTAEITIEEPEPANFSVGDLDAPSTVTQGDTVTVTANVTNLGDSEGTQDVDFRLDSSSDGTLGADETVANETLTLAGTETQTVEFEVPTDEVPVGTYLHGVVTQNDSQTAEITIEEPEPANFSVSDLDAPSTVTQGDTVTVTANVTNVGELERTQTVSFQLDANTSGTFEGDETFGAESVTLGGGETDTVEFEVSTDTLDPDTYDHRVSTANDSQTAALTVEAAEDEPEPEPEPEQDGGDGATNDFTTEVTAQDEGALVEFSDAGANRRYAISLGSTVGANGVSVTGYELFFDRGVRDGSFEFTSSETVPDDAPELSNALVYITVAGGGVDDSDLAEVEFEFTVPLSTLDELGIEPSELRLYRYEDNGWASYETNHQGGGVFRAENIPGFSVFAVGPADAAVVTETPTPEPTTDTPTPEPTTDTPTPEPTTDTPTPEPTDTAAPETVTTTETTTTSTQFPGFTPVLTLVALLVSTVAAARFIGR